MALGNFKFVFFAAAIGAGFFAATDSDRGDGTIEYSAGDRTMNDAQDAASKSLPTFFANALDAGGRSVETAMVKVAFPITSNGQSGVEVIWVGPFERSGDAFTGRLANNPQSMPEEIGDAVEFSENMIRDWMVQGPDGQIYGNYTTRVMLADMSPEASAQLQAVISKNPIPANW